MPKRYSEQEKEHIRKRLKEEAAKCLTKYGIRRTTVEELVEEHLRDDRSMVDELLEIIPGRKEVDAKALSTTFRAIFFSTLHKEKIGEENYEKALFLLVHGVVDQLI
ncbi:MAG: hypothetical protein ACI4FX_11100 [Agathobacter sp.]